MTCVMACITVDNKAVIVSDAAVAFSNGYRRLLPEPKIWDMKRLVIGEAGSDFALSRIRMRTRDHESWEELRDPYSFADLVCKVQTDVKGTIGTEPIEAELLHCGADEEGKASIHIIGGDGGVSGPYDYTAVGHGQMPAVPLMDVLLKPKYTPKRTVHTVTNRLLEIMELVTAYSESVCGVPGRVPPFFTHTYDPNDEFEAL